MDQAGTERGRAPAGDMRCVVVSLDQAQSGRMLRRLCGTQALPHVTFPWGSRHAYEELLTSPRPLALLDVPTTRWADDDLGRRTALLRRLAPVIVLVPPGFDAAALLDAGASNVLPRHVPVREFAVRLAADRRWLSATAPPPSPHGRSPRQVCAAMPSHGSQRLLLLLLTRTGTRPWCCHDLALLLGPPGRPMSRRAVHARLSRLRSPLLSMGLTLLATTTWGRTTYAVR